MNTPGRYPFSDLTPEQIQMLVRAAAAERQRMMRVAFAGLLHWLRHPLTKPQADKREAAATCSPLMQMARHA